MARVGIGSDLRGHTGYGRQRRVVRLAPGKAGVSRAELLLRRQTSGWRRRRTRPSRWRVIFVPAFSGDLFHYTGNFSQNIAIRNAYAEVENLGLRGLTLWAGSRMYRGDDVIRLTSGRSTT